MALMIWRSRSFSARSSSSSVLRVLGSSGRGGAEVLTSRLDHARQELTTTSRASYWRAVDVTHVGFRWRGSDGFLSWRGGRDGTSDHDPNGFRDGGGSAPHGETAGL